MKIRRQTRLVHEGEYVAEVEIELIETDDKWSPYLSKNDALKLDDVRLALQRNDLRQASQLANVYRLTPVTA